MWLSDLDMAVSDLMKVIDNCCISEVIPCQTIGCGAGIIFHTTGGDTYLWQEKNRKIEKYLLDRPISF